MKKGISWLYAPCIKEQIDMVIGIGLWDNISNKGTTNKYLSSNADLHEVCDIINRRTRVKFIDMN